MSLIATTTYSSYVLGTSFQPNQTFMYGVCAYDENGCESPLATTGFSSMQKQKVKANNLISSDINSQAELNLYPNPVVNKLYIDGISQTFDVVVTNLQGQIIKSETKLSNSIDLSELRSGVYIIKIKYDKTEIIRRIIKQ